MFKPVVNGKGPGFTSVAAVAGRETETPTAARIVFRAALLLRSWCLGVQAVNQARGCGFPYTADNRSGSRMSVSPMVMRCISLVPS